jgi:hypothetical protein
MFTNDIVGASVGELAGRRLAAFTYRDSERACYGGLYDLAAGTWRTLGACLLLPITYPQALWTGSRIMLLTWSPEWAGRMPCGRPVHSTAGGVTPVQRIPRMAPETSGCCARVTWPSMSRRKCTVQRCQGQPSTWAMAALRPA